MPLQPEQPIETFRALIKGDDAPANRCPQTTADGTLHDIEGFATLLDGFQEARAAWAKRQVALADDFNLFRVIGVEHNEVSHSKILAWLLDGRLEHGSHAQGNLGFRLFIEEIGADLGAESTPQITSYPDEAYWVRREVRGKNSIVDIEIAAPGKFIIHIENKIRSLEGEDQTHREWRDVERRARQLGIPSANVHAIFLTLDCSPPEDDHFVAIGWHRLVPVLAGFADKAQPREVKVFVAHYAEAVRRLAIIESAIEEGINDDSAV